MLAQNPKWLRFITEPNSFEGITVLGLSVVFLIFSVYAIVKRKRIAWVFAAELFGFVFLTALALTILVGYSNMPKAESDYASPLDHQLARLKCFLLCYATFAGVISLHTFLVQMADKWNAVHNSKLNEQDLSAFRIPERLLHRSEFLGGWFGSLVSQHLFRHKISKSTYQWTFGSIVATHGFGIAAYTAFVFQKTTIALVCLGGVLISIKISHFVIQRVSAEKRCRREQFESNWDSDETT